MCGEEAGSWGSPREKKSLDKRGQGMSHATCSHTLSLGELLCSCLFLMCPCPQCIKKRCVRHAYKKGGTGHARYEKRKNKTKDTTYIAKLVFN